MPKKTKKKSVKPKAALKAKAKKTVRKAASRPARKAATAAKKAAPAKSGKRSPGKLAAGSGYQPAPNERTLGLVDDYFAKVGVIAVYLKDKLAVGDVIHVHGHTTEYTIKVESMQIEHKVVQSAQKGDSVGIRVPQKSRKGDRVFRVD